MLTAEREKLPIAQGGIRSLTRMIRQYEDENDKHLPGEHYQLLFMRALGLSDLEELRAGPHRAGGGAHGEDVTSILHRVHELARGAIDPHIVSQLRDTVLDTVAHYETSGPDMLVPSLLKQRALAQALLGESRRPSQQRELLEVAGVVAGVLAYVAVRPGDFGLARSYCREAFILGDYAEAPALQAWARATESFCEYYAGRYDEAVRLAHDGLTYAGSVPQSARLHANRTALALGMQGPDAPGTLTARSFLASAYRAAGDLPAASPLHQQNLADCERVLGTDHPQTLVARANLAYLYALQDQPARALELHQRNLADCERVHGPDHPHTLNVRANLASCYRALGDLPHAIALHRQSVTDSARVFGDDHAETITARSNLAYAYQLAHDYGHAIPLHRQVLTDRERLYGPHHHYTELARQLFTTAQQQASADEVSAVDQGTLY
jgi:tetratricopeptide (TPR) repeat protein